MDPSDFPPLNSQGDNSKQDTSLESSWADVAKEPPHHTSPPPEPSAASPLKPSYAATAGHEANYPTPAEQSTGKFLKEDPPDFIPPNPARSYADVSSHAGFPSLDESVEREAPPANDLSDLPPVSEMLEQPSAPKIPPVPANASFAKMAAKSPPPETSPPPPAEEEKPPVKEKEATEPSKPLSIYDEDKFPSLDSSTQNLKPKSTELNNISSSLLSKNSEQMGQSYVEAASQDLDQAPPSAQARVDTQPSFNENHMMTESARRETRRMKQMENSGQIDEMTPEMTNLPQKQANVDQDIPMEERQEQQQTQDRGIADTVKPPSERQYKDKFTVFNTITTLHENGYSWFTSIATAVLLHLRYSPCTSPYRFPFIYRSVTDIVMLPIYIKPLQPTLLSLPILQQQSRQQLDQSIAEHGYSQKKVTGLRLQDGFRVLKNIEKDHRLRWWQIGLWASHRMQWTVSYMALQDVSTHLVTSSTLLSLKNADDQV